MRLDLVSGELVRRCHYVEPTMLGDARFRFQRDPLLTTPIIWLALLTTGTALMPRSASSLASAVMSHSLSTAITYALMQINRSGVVRRTALSPHDPPGLEPPCCVGI